MDQACRSIWAFWGAGGACSVPILRPRCPEGGTVTPGTGGPTQPRAGPASRALPSGGGGSRAVLLGRRAVMKSLY